MADPVEKLSQPDTQQVAAPALRPPPTSDSGPVPTLSSDMTFRDIGTSGLRQFAGWVREEFLPQLQGRQAARVYREMSDNSPVVGGILTAIQATMRKVEWRVLPPDEDEVPTGDMQERIDFVSSCMDDMSHTWSELIAENLSMLQYGFAPHELCYKRRDGRKPGKDPQNPRKDLPKSQYDDGLVGWKRIPIRGQDTIIKWFFSHEGDIEGLTQQPYVGSLVDIPMEKLLLFRPTVMKNNPEGRSILRNAYINYYYVKRLEQQEAITYERLGGLPVGRLPGDILARANSGDGDAQKIVNEMKKIVTNVRIDEQMGMVLPSTVYEGANGASSIYLYDIDFKTPQVGRSGTNPNEAITRHTANMLISVLADWLQLGHTTRGTQGLSTNKVDMFFQAVEGYLNGMAEVYNRHALPQLWDLNGFDPEVMPRIVPDLAIRTDLDVLSNYVMRLSQAGMPMFPNEELQSMLLDAAGLPDVVDPMAQEAAGLTDELIANQTDQALNPPELDTASPNLKKMLAASLARRLIRYAGPRFGVVTKRQGRRTRAQRIAKLGAL